MEVPAIDYVKKNARRTDRIIKENRIHTRNRSSGFEARVRPVKTIGKVTNSIWPSERKLRVLEFMHLKQASKFNEEFEFARSSSPRSKSLLPVSTAQETGWTSTSDKVSDDAHLSRLIVPGLYNWDRRFSSTDKPTNHVKGYVTLVGVDSHPKRVDSLGLKCPGEVDDSLMPESSVHSNEVEEELDIPNHKEDSGVSVPTALAQIMDTKLRKEVALHSKFLNKAGSKWFRPIKQDDITRFGDDYVRVLSYGPFNKTQLLIDR